MKQDLIYLDNAATSWPKPDSVYSFMVDHFRKCGVNPGRSGFDLAIEAGNIIAELRQRLTDFFGGDRDTPERLCFSYNATDALNLIIQGLLEPGDHVVTTNLEHNSVIRPINHMVQTGQVTATYVPFNGQGFIDPDDIKAAFLPNTKLVVVNHGSNVIGTVQPITEIGAYCCDRKILFAIDASQTAGVVPIDMKQSHVDVLAFTGHKALLGSTGIGGLCVRKHVDIRHTRSGGTGVRSAYPYHLEEYPWRLEYGTPNTVGIASLWAGQEWLDERGIENIHAQEMALTQKLVDGLRQIPEVTTYCCDSLENHISTTIINIQGLDASDVGILLDVDHNIATRTGLHCAPLVHKQLGLLESHGATRLSVGPFNEEQHIDEVLIAVRAIAQWAKKRR